MTTPKAIRCVQLLMLIQNGQEYSIDVVAERMGVSRRTIFRDLKVVRAAVEGVASLADTELQIPPSLSAEAALCPDLNGGTIAPLARGKPQEMG